MSNGTINLENIERCVALVSDTHVGSNIAVWPDESIYTKEGNNLSAGINAGQKVLLRGWHEFLGVCDEFKVDTVIHFGDATQGCNPFEGGIETITPDVDYQLDACEELMKPLVKDRIYHQFSGTKYHEVLNFRIHRELVRRLKSEAKEAVFQGKVANIGLRGTKKVLNCAHAATSAMIYPAGVIDRELLFAKVAMLEGKIPKFDYLIRGHLHKFLHIDYPDIHGVQLPAWQAWYPLGDKVRLYGRTQPDIGGALLLIDKKNRSILLHFVYPCPHLIDFIKDG